MLILCAYVLFEFKTFWSTLAPNVSFAFLPKPPIALSNPKNTTKKPHPFGRGCGGEYRARTIISKFLEANFRAKMAFVSKKQPQKSPILNDIFCATPGCPLEWFLLHKIWRRPSYARDKVVTLFHFCADGQVEKSTTLHTWHRGWLGDNSFGSLVGSACDELPTSNPRHSAHYYL